MREIAITVDIAPVLAMLNRLHDAGVDMTPAMKDIAGHLADTTRERFETGTDPEGRPWKPSRRVLGLDGSRSGHGPFAMEGKTLVLTGDLMNSIAEDWGADYAAAGPEASGGAAVYALIHQLGGKIYPKNRSQLSFGGKHYANVTIPARPYVGFNEENATYAADVLAEHLDRAIRGSA